ncbi:MAG: hypothetical protein QNI95_19075 [Desulfobacterales bacterium]|nr:hypothetical protein [Desulfobacterales bacterium]
MRELTQIITEYRQGDFEKRLHLFLECPALRDEFMMIDINGNDSVIESSRKLDLAVRGQNSADSRISFFNGWIGLLRKAFSESWKKCCN